MKIVLATRNENKLREVKQFLEPNGIEVVSLNEFPDFPEIEENGETFKDNATKKATEACMFTGLTALADDSGLEVDSLNDLPGIYSARFAGEHKSDEDNNNKLLELLEGLPEYQRKARFRCVMAVATTECFVYTAEGVCEGFIAEEPRGEGGFGYDPIFYLPEQEKTFAELDLETKNKISHRARALIGVLDIFSELKTMAEEDKEE